MELSLKQIFTVSLKFGRANFKKMLPYTVCMFVYLEAMVLAGALWGNSAKAPIITSPSTFVAIILIGLLLLSYLILLVSIVVIPKVHMAVLIFVRSILESEQLSFGEAMGRTAGKYWRYAGNMLLVVLFILALFIFTALAGRAGAAAVLIIKAFYSFIIPALFFMITPMIAYEDKRGVVIARAIKMLKGFFPQTLLIVLAFSGMLMLIQGALDIVFANYKLAVFAVDVIMNLGVAALFPFFSVAQMLIYDRQTVHKKNQQKKLAAQYSQWLQ